MSKRLNISKDSTKPFPRLSLADLIAPDIDAGFQCKMYLYASWDLCKAMAIGESEGEIESINNAFQEAASVINDRLYGALNRAVQKGANKTRGEKRGIISPRALPAL